MKKDKKEKKVRHPLGLSDDDWGWYQKWGELNRFSTTTGAMKHVLYAFRKAHEAEIGEIKSLPRSGAKG